MDDSLNIQAGIDLFKKPTNFYKSVNHMRDLPDFGKAEVAFAGRSNVGKSTLINKITGQTIARASNTPGRTQMLNFFEVNEHLDLVDMPGYGFAKAPKAQVDTWQTLVRAYLKGRPTLKRVYLLIDSRRGVMKVDEDIMDMLDACAVSYHIVLTKSDKLKAQALEIVKEQAIEKTKKRPAAYPEILLTSSEKHVGLDELRAHIAALI